MYVCVLVVLAMDCRMIITCVTPLRVTGVACGSDLRTTPPCWAYAPIFFCVTDVPNVAPSSATDNGVAREPPCLRLELEDGVISELFNSVPAAAIAEEVCGLAAGVGASADAATHMDPRTPKRARAGESCDTAAGRGREGRELRRTSACADTVLAMVRALCEANEVSLTPSAPSSEATELGGAARSCIQLVLDVLCRVECDECDVVMFGGRSLRVLGAHLF